MPIIFAQTVPFHKKCMPFSGKPGCQRATGSFWEEGVQKYMHETVFLLWGSGKLLIPHDGLWGYSSN